MIMEAHGNEYAQQLLDRAANMLTAVTNESDTDQQQVDAWLREYHAEKARFGQPLGSPAYTNAVQAARGEEVPAQQRQARADAGVDTADAGVPGEDASLAELQAEARRRGLPTSGTKADLRERLDDDAHAANG